MSEEKQKTPPDNVTRAEFEAMLKCYILFKRKKKIIDARKTLIEESLRQVTEALMNYANNRGKSLTFAPDDMSEEEIIEAAKELNGELIEINI